jgi:DNA-directed RNA polymerase specialized sigma24 family protein
MTAPYDDRDFDTLCRVVAHYLGVQNDRNLDAQEERELAHALRNVSESLPKLLASRRGTHFLDPQDVAQEAVGLFVKAAASGRIRADRSPAGYLMRTATNVVITALRRPAPPQLLGDDDVIADPISPDETVALIDRLASRDTVRAALRASAEEGDDTTVAVIGAWLDQAAIEGREPSIRAVAALAGVSHTSVVRCLARFRSRLAEEPPE